MDVNIQAVMGICSNYMAEEGGVLQEISVVISPLKIDTEKGDGKLQITSGCNMWRSCHNPDCWYSISARVNKKAQPGK